MFWRLLKTLAQSTLELPEDFLTTTNNSTDFATTANNATNILATSTNSVGNFFDSILNGDMTLLLIIIIVIAIIIVAFTAFLVFQSRRKHQRESLELRMDELEARKNSILSSTVELSLAKIRAFEQTDRVTQHYRTWSGIWNGLQTKMQTEFPMELSKLDAIIENNEFKAFPDVEASIKIELDTEEQKIKELEDAMTDFILKEENLQKDFETVKETLKQVAQLFFANKSSLSTYDDQIKAQIQELEKELFTIINSDDFTDRSEASQALADVNENILKEHKLIKELPNAIVLHDKILVPQLTALKQVYTEMIEQKYLFQGLSLDSRIEKLEEKVIAVKQDIDDLQLSSVESTGAYIRKQIEEIHQIFVNEKSAKDDVENAIDSLNQRMNRLRFDKESFLQEWNDITKRYEITRQQMQQVDVFSAQVLSAETRMIQYNNQYEKNEEANVVLADELKNFMKHLNELEHSLEKLRGNMDTVKEDEVYIHAQYKQLKFMHHRSKRKIYQVPLETLSEEYMMKNEEAVRALNEIKKHLNQEVLDVTLLTELIGTAQHLSIRFYKDTNMIVKAASFAEKAIIYSNRYRFDRDVQRNLAKAEYYYIQGDFTEALDIALTTLEAVEPGIYERLFEAYEAAVEKENQ